VATQIWSRWVKRIKAPEETVAMDQVLSTKAGVTKLQYDFFHMVERAQLGNETSMVMARIMLAQMPVSEQDARTMCDLVMQDAQFPMRWKSQGRTQVLWCWNHEQRQWIAMITNTQVDASWQMYGRQLWLVLQAYWMWYVKVRCYTSLYVAIPGVSRDQLYQNSIGLMGGYESSQEMAAHIDKLARMWHDMLKNKSL
jgi:hypothetical protein